MFSPNTGPPEHAGPLAILCSVVVQQHKNAARPKFEQEHDQGTEADISLVAQTRCTPSGVVQLHKSGERA